MSITMLAGCTQEKSIQTTDETKLTEPITEQKNNIKSEAYIEGVHNISIPVGTNVNTLVNELTSNVTSSGYVEVDYSNVDLNKPGKYTVTFTSDDGANAEVIVTVTK